MKTILSFIILLMVLTVNGQGGKQSYATRLYGNMEYLKSSEVLSEIVNKAYKKGDLNHDLVSKCALSYYKIRDYKNTIKYLNMDIESLNENDYEILLDSYLRLNNIEKAVELIKKFPAYNTYDRSKNVLLNMNKELYMDSSNYAVSKLVTVNSEDCEFSPYVTKDGIYFTSNRKEKGYTNSVYKYDNSFYCKSYFARKENDYDFKEIELIDELSSKFHDGAISLSSDGKYLMITRNDLSESKNKAKQTLFLIEYKNVSGKWVENGKFPFNSETYNVGHATYSSDGNTIYFSSDMPGGYGGSDLYKSTRSGTGWTKPINLGGKVNTVKNELFPFLNESGELYFTSNGHAGIGGLDIYSFNKNTGAVQNLGYPVNTTSDDFSFMLVGEIGYFSSDRSSGEDNIYAVLIKPIKGTLIIDVFANNIQLKDNVEVYLKDKTTGDSTRVYFDNNNKLVSEVLNNHEYEIVALKENHTQVSPVEFKLNGIHQGDYVRKRIDLESEYNQVNILALDKTTKEPLPFVRGVFLNSNKEKVEFVTDSIGKASVVLVEDKTYNVEASKKGYLPYSDSVYVQKDIVVELELPLIEIKKNVKFEVKNILYDFAKYDLRPESIIELDKLAEFLLSNDIKVELSSHTDCRGSDPKNQILSQKRAESCVNYLIKKGVNPKNIIARGYGEAQLLNKCDDGVECSEEEHQANRRTEVKILALIE